MTSKSWFLCSFRLYVLIGQILGLLPFGNYKETPSSHTWKWYHSINTYVILVILVAFAIFMIHYYLTTNFFYLWFLGSIFHIIYSMSIPLIFFNYKWALINLYVELVDINRQLNTFIYKPIYCRLFSTYITAISSIFTIEIFQTFKNRSFYPSYWWITVIGRCLEHIIQLTGEYVLILFISAIVKQFDGLSQRIGKKSSTTSVKNNIEVYKDLCSVISQLNDIFSPLMFICICYWSMRVCAFTYELIKSDNAARIDQLFVWIIFYDCFYVLKLFVFVHLCNKVSDKAEDTKLHLLSCVAKIKSASCTYLAYLQSCKRPQLTAGGFFVIGRQIFLAIAGAIVTYLIILEQFKIDVPKNIPRTFNTNTSEE